MMALVFEPAGDTAVVVAATPATAALGVEFVVGEDFIDEPELEDEDEDEVREVEDDVWDVWDDVWDDEVCELEEDVDGADEDVLDGAADGLKFTPVYTTCNNRSVGWPVNEVSTVAAWSEDPQLYCEYPPGYAFRKQ
jgi:hypothetical protein